jgi:hypothetical protein
MYPQPARVDRRRGSLSSPIFHWPGARQTSGSPPPKGRGSRTPSLFPCKSAASWEPRWGHDDDRGPSGQAPFAAGKPVVAVGAGHAPVVAVLLGLRTTRHRLSGTSAVRLLVRDRCDEPDEGRFVAVGVSAAVVAGAMATFLALRGGSSDGSRAGPLNQLPKSVFAALRTRPLRLPAFSAKAAPLRWGRNSGSRSGFRAHSEPKAHSDVVRCTRSRGEYPGFSTSSRQREGVRSPEADGGATRRCGLANRVVQDQFSCGAG